MISPRKILGTLGVIGTAGWGFLACIAAMLASRVSASDLFFGFFPLVVFVFYAVIAIRPCRASTALAVGAALHVPQLFVIARWAQGGHEAPLYASALVFGAVVWAVYVVQLRRHENTP